MREVKTEIDIAAPSSEVWRILTDINHWQEWNPIVKQASGEASPDSTLTITMCSKEGKGGKDGPKYMPVITNCEAPKRFRWRAKMMAGFLFTNDKVFELEDTSNGTHLVHKETYDGWLVPMFWNKLNENVPSMLNSMNDSLKELAEKNTH